MKTNFRIGMMAIIFFTLICGMILTVSTAQAAPIINLAYSGNGGSVIAFSSQLNGSFAATKIIDGLGITGGTVNAATTVSDGSNSYWLASTKGTSIPEFVTIDLGALASISQFRIGNTDNQSFHDRGADTFSIFASTSVTGGVLNSPTTLISNQALTGWPFSNSNAIPVDVFNGNYGVFRYVEIQVSISPTQAASVGLNEFQVIGVVPEPASLGLVVIGATMLMRRQRRHA